MHALLARSNATRRSIDDVDNEKSLSGSRAHQREPRRTCHADQRLAEIFATLRASNIDLSNALLVAPSYTAPPQLVQPDVLYLRGYFGIRPTSVEFELYYQWMAGKWRLYGVSIVPLQVAGVAPPQQARPAPAPAAAPEKKRNR